MEFVDALPAQPRSGVKFVDNAPDGYRTCRKCLQVKPENLDNFRWSNKGNDFFTWASYCMPCEKNYARERRESAEGVVKERMNYGGIKHRYKRSFADYNTTLAAQGGGCAACGKPPGRSRLHWDHDHSCCPGRNTCGNCVRGLLCAYCNVVAAAIENKVVEKVLAYLGRWK